MRVIVGLTALVAALGVCTMPVAVNASLLGGFKPAKLTPELETVLVKSLQNEKLYQDGVTARVCVTKVVSVEQQVVAGMNYRFKVNVCDVAKTLSKSSDGTPKAEEITKQLGQCKLDFAKGCVAHEAVVTVYQALDDSTKVSGIEFQAEDDAAPASVHAAEA